MFIDWKILAGPGQQRVWNVVNPNEAEFPVNIPHLLWQNVFQPATALYATRYTPKSYGFHTNLYARPVTRMTAIKKWTQALNGTAVACSPIRTGRCTCRKGYGAQPYCKLHNYDDPRGRLYTHIFLYRNCEVHKYFITIYRYVFKYIWHALLLMHT